MLATDTRLFWLDCETTGLDPEQNEIISICLATHEAQPEGPPLPVVFAKYFLPIGPVSPEAARVNGYSPERWAELGAEPWSLEDLRTIKHMVEGKIPAGHNVAFDLGFLTSYFRRAGRDVPGWSHRKLDTQAMAMPLYLAGEIKSAALAACAEHFGLGVQDHTSAGDVTMTIALFGKLCERFGIATIG